MSSIRDVLRIESEQLRLHFEKASLVAKGTSQDVSDRREVQFAETLRRYFPYPAAVAKGRIEDIQGQRSNSIDCVVLSPGHPLLIDTDGHRTALLAEGVDFAVEVKPDLGRVDEVERALKQGISVKRLVRNRCGMMEIGNRRITPHHRKIPYIVYSQKTFDQTKSLLSRIVDYYEENKTPRLLQFDMILVNQRSLVLNLTPVVPGFELQSGLVWADLKEDALAAFLAILLMWPKSEMTIGSPVLGPYLSIKKDGWKTFHDLNVRLASLG